MLANKVKRGADLPLRAVEPRPIFKAIAVTNKETCRGAMAVEQPGANESLAYGEVGPHLLRGRR